jgi:acyl-ACP thioesterase
MTTHTQNFYHIGAAPETVLPVWYESFSIRHSEVDSAGNLKLKTLSDYLQEAAAAHADHLNAGLRHLRQNNLMWVLSRIKINIFNHMNINESVTVETWPGKFEKLFAKREFVVRSREGKTLCQASSAWLLVDVEKLRPQRESRLPVALPDNSHRQVFFPELDKLERLPANKAFSVRVRHSTIDVNGHLNNAEYSAWIHDYLAEKTNCSLQLKEIQINFIAEARQGDDIEICGTINDNTFYVEGTCSGKLIFQSTGQLKRLS